MESQIWSPPAGSVTPCEEGQWPLPVLLSGRKLPPPATPAALALMPDAGQFSFSPHVSLMSFDLLPPCWNSEGVSPSKFVHGPFKRNCLRLQQFMSPTASIPTVFCSKKLWDFSCWHWNPGLGSLMWGWDPLLLRYPSCFLICHIWVWDQPISHLCHSYQSQCGFFLNSVVGFFFNSIVVGLPFSSISDGFE